MRILLVAMANSVHTVRLSFPPGDPFRDDALRGAYWISSHFLRQGGLRWEFVKGLIYLLFCKPSFFLDTRFRRFAYTAIPGRKVIESVFRLLFRGRVIDVPNYRLPATAFAGDEFDPNWMYHTEVKVK